MVRLSFGSLTIVQFRSFQEATIDLSAYGTGLHFLRGRNDVEPRLGANGAGKSSVFAALCWCLYGRTVEGLRNTDVRPWSGRKGTCVTVSVSADGEQHVVRRTAGPNRLHLDDTEVDNNAVERLLGLSFVTFTNTVLFGQGQPLFFDLPPRDKMQLFSDALNLEVWDMRADRASARVGELELELSSDTGRLQALEESQIPAAEELVDDLKRKSDVWAKEASGDRQRLEQELAAQTKKRAAVKSKLDKATLDYDGASTELRQLRRDKDTAVLALRAAERELAAAEATVKAAERRKGELQDTLDKFKSGRCPICDRTLKGTTVDEHLGEVRAELKSIRAGVPKSVSLAVDSAQKTVDRTSTHISSFQSRADEAEALVSHLTREEATLAGECRALERQLEASEEAANPYREQIAEARRALAALRKDVEELSATIDKRAASIERIRFWVKGFREIRLLVVDELLMELTVATNALLGEAGLLGWEVIYDTERETKSGSTQRALSTVIKSPHNAEAVRWEAWSGGEGQRLRLVGSLALSEVLLSYAGVVVDFEVLDEPTRHLSEEGVHDLCEFLAERARRLERRVFYIDHMAVESSRFSSITTVVKGSDGSMIQQEGADDRRAAGSFAGVDRQPRRKGTRRALAS